MTDATTMEHLKRFNEASISFPDLPPIIVIVDDDDDDDENKNEKPLETFSEHSTTENQSSKIINN